MSAIEDILNSVTHDDGCSASMGASYVCKCRMAERVVEAKRELQWLRLRSDILADWDTDRLKVTEEQCPSDEKHCACVPILRAEVAAKQAGWDRALELLGDATRRTVENGRP